MSSTKKERVLAWTESRVTYAFVERAGSIATCRKVFRCARSLGKTICLRGAGYSYADAILNNDGFILDTSRMDKILHFNNKNGLLTVEPGVTFGKIMRTVFIHGWTIPACVGGMGVTVGGGLSSNVHGKDAWRVGNFGANVVELQLLTASGKVLIVSKKRMPKLFHAVVGGMGLLGVILNATIQLQKASSPFVLIQKIPVRDMSEMLDTLEQSRSREDFMVAWVDAFARGKVLGRGIVETACWVDQTSPITQSRIDASLSLPTRILRIFPATRVWTSLRPFFRPSTIQRVNSAYYTIAHIRGHQQRTLLFTNYNFMLNKIPGWKKLYRPQGYVEFQPLLPRRDAKQTITKILRMCQHDGMESLLCGLKLHKKDNFLLSYAGDGYSLGIDVAMRFHTKRSLSRFAHRLYSYVADHGGTTFLAKDELLPRVLFRRMYPRYREFLAIKQSVDPENLFASDMYRRLLAP